MECWPWERAVLTLCFEVEEECREELWVLETLECLGLEWVVVVADVKAAKANTTKRMLEALRRRFALGNDHLSGKFMCCTNSSLIVMSC